MVRGQHVMWQLSVDRPPGGMRCEVTRLGACCEQAAQPAAGEAMARGTHRVAYGRAARLQQLRPDVEVAEKTVLRG